MRTIKSAKTAQQLQSKQAVRRALAYLKSCGIRVPDFDLTFERGRLIFGNSSVEYGERLRLNMGRFPTDFLRNWVAMHEIGHLLWALHRPLKWKRFRHEFSAPSPDEETYYRIHRRQSFKTPATFRLSWYSGPHRPNGEPSWYGAKAGGEERFCELIGLMYAHGDFAAPPPRDLESLWETCWTHGLSRMV